jgi:hypothetical protein
MGRSRSPWCDSPRSASDRRTRPGPERYGHVRDAEVRRAMTANADYLQQAATKTATDDKTRRAASESKRVEKFPMVNQLAMARPQRDSNPCFGLERATSWASGRWGPAGENSR